MPDLFAERTTKGGGAEDSERQTDKQFAEVKGGSFANTHFRQALSTMAKELSDSSDETLLLAIKLLAGRDQT